MTTKRFLFSQTGTIRYFFLTYCQYSLALCLLRNNCNEFALKYSVFFTLLAQIAKIPLYLVIFRRTVFSKVFLFLLKLQTIFRGGKWLLSTQKESKKLQQEDTTYDYFKFSIPGKFSHQAQKGNPIQPTAHWTKQKLIGRNGLRLFLVPSIPRQQHTSSVPSNTPFSPPGP